MNKPSIIKRIFSFIGRVIKTIFGVAFAPIKGILIGAIIAILCTILFFLFGLACKYVEPMGEVVEKLFNALPFWNEKWDSNWTLYFGLIAGGITAVWQTISGIIDAFHKPPQTINYNTYYAQPKGWDNLSKEEQDAWLRRNHPEMFTNEHNNSEQIANNNNTNIDQ